jgi:hypothetical protein
MRALVQLMRAINELMHALIQLMLSANDWSYLQLFEF